MTVIVRGGLLALGLWALSGCQSPEASGDLDPAPLVVEASTRYRKQYLLAPGDHFDVIVRGHPEVSRIRSTDGFGVEVRPDGYISLPVVDEVKAAGLTIAQLDATLTEQFSHRFVEPEVSILATNLREPMVYVLGEVASPRAVPHRMAATAAQAIAHAGGLKHTAQKNAVALIRLTPEGRLRAYTIPVGVKGQPGPYMALQATIMEPDDVIFAPESGIAQFDRWVDDYVNQPLSGINSVLAPVANFLLIQDLVDDN